MQRRIKVAISPASAKLLQEERGDRAELATRLAAAIVYYLADGSSTQAGWDFPDFRRSDNDGVGTSVELVLDAELWDEFAEEAERQGVSTNQLLEHAALYLVAAQDSGRVAKRLADELD